MDLDFPAPNKPWMHRSSRLVRRALWQWDTVVPSGLAKVLLFVKAAPILAKKVTAESHFRSCKTLLSERRKPDNAFVCESRQFL